MEPPPLPALAALKPDARWSQDAVPTPSVSTNVAGARWWKRTWRGPPCLVPLHSQRFIPAPERDENESLRVYRLHEASGFF